jgi:F-type H+-transporting ATPase subunit gamma
VRFCLQRFDKYSVPVQYISVGRKGRDILLRLGKHVLAEFSNLPAAPTFADVSSIGRLVVDDFLSGKIDEVYLVYTDFISMVRQVPTIKKLLPLEFDSGEGRVADFRHEGRGLAAAYIYEPGEQELLDEIIPRFTALQVYQAILESLASEHAARMVAMKNATDSASELAGVLTLEYNKARQQSITSEMLDIAGGAEALSK